MTRGEAVRLGGALLVGMALAFPIARMVAGERAAPPARAVAERRAMFSPDVRGDPYVLDQLRGQVEALEAYAAGQSLTEAAHLAGFSDSAHFSRVFKRTFGLPATTLTRL